MTVLHDGQTASKVPDKENENLNGGGNLQSDTAGMQQFMPQPQQNFGQDAVAVMQRFVYNQQGVGTTPNVAKKFKDADRSMIERQMNGEAGGDDLPQGPGYTYFNHLFNRAGGKVKDQENKKKKMTRGSNIYTEAQEALKVAIKAMGVATSMNPTGLPIDIGDAQSIWYGEDDVDENEKMQWRTSVEMGDARIDPKKVRKFTNYDGSMTWEILNDDKTVSSRFTLGEYAGTKIFSQGGYNKFVELMKKVKEQVGYDDSTGFDAVRGSYR